MVASLEQETGQSLTTSTLLQELETLQAQTDEIVAATETDTTLRDGEERAAEVEASLDEVNGLLLNFQEMDTAVLVAPFKSESLSITQVRLEPMHFYVPAVIALFAPTFIDHLVGLEHHSRKNWRFNGAVPRCTYLFL